MSSFATGSTGPAWPTCLRVDGAAADSGHCDRCLRQCEDFGIATESVRYGIPLGVRIVDGTGREVSAGPTKAPAA